MRLPLRGLSATMACSLCVLLVILAASAIWTARQGERAIDRAERATRVSQAYTTARMYALQIQATAEHVSGSPSAANVAAFNTAILGTLESLKAISIYGDTRDLAFMSALEREYTPQFQAIEAYVEAAGSSEMAAPLFTVTLGNDLMEAVAPTADARSKEATQLLLDKRRFQQLNRWLSLSVYGMAIALTGWYSYSVRGIQRFQSQNSARMNELRHEALTDELTGLNNLRAFGDEFRREVARASRYGEPLSIAMIDIDRFKEVNDTWGHQGGDAVLKSFAALLMESREQDRVFRVGGDEFAMILPHTDLNGAVAIVERLRTTALKRLSGATISVGVPACRPTKTMAPCSAPARTRRSTKRNIVAATPLSPSTAAQKPCPQLRGSRRKESDP